MSGYYGSDRHANIARPDEPWSHRASIDCPVHHTWRAARLAELRRRGYSTPLHIVFPPPIPIVVFTHHSP